jgi:hypothetical protein
MTDVSLGAKGRQEANPRARTSVDFLLSGELYKHVAGQNERAGIGVQVAEFGGEILNSADWGEWKESVV